VLDLEASHGVAEEVGSYGGLTFSFHVRIILSKCSRSTAYSFRALVASVFRLAIVLQVVSSSYTAVWDVDRR
jgi:hypothetical protein